uniref:Transmembrane protein n=1 Tax=Alexandrium andersonii TaxID=327968 RepID=A0A7S2AGY7_9DINO
MVPFRRPSLLLLLFCGACLELLFLTVNAQEAEQPASADADDAAQADDSGTGEDAASVADASESSLEELQKKLSQLKELVQKRGVEDPEWFKEKFEALSKQLSSMGLDSSNLGGDSQKDAEIQVLTACLTLSIKSEGPRKSGTFSALQRMASGTLKAAEASELPLMRMVAVCAMRLSNTEYQSFTSGKLTSMPKPLVDKAALPAAKEDVLALEKDIPSVWELLPTVAAPLRDTMKEAAAKESGPASNTYGLVAAVPLLLAIAFLAKKFVDMQNAQRERESSKKEKAAKKKQK